MMQLSLKKIVLVLIISQLPLSVSFCADGNDPFRNFGDDAPTKQELVKIQAEEDLWSKVKLWDEVKILNESPKLKEGKQSSLIYHREKLMINSLSANTEASAQKLINILKDKTRALPTRIAAAHMLGDLRSPKAVDALIEQEPFVSPRMSHMSYRERAPCFSALCRIGKPASRKALLLLKSKKDRTDTSLLSSIIFVVEGRDVAIFLLKAEIEKTNNKEVIPRLESAIQIVTRLHDKGYIRLKTPTKID